MIRHSVCIAAVFLLVGLALAHDATAGDSCFQIVSNRVPQVKIVRTGNARVDKDLAYFTNAIFRATGALLPLVERTDDRQSAICLTLEKRPIPQEDAWRIDFPSATACASSVPKRVAAGR